MGFGDQAVQVRLQHGALSSLLKSCL
jgi:hypothetical protein